MRREHVVKIRVSSAERDRLDQLVEAWGYATRSRMLRELVRAAGRPDEPVLLGVDSLEMVIAQITEFDAGD